MHLCVKLKKSEWAEMQTWEREKWERIAWIARWSSKQALHLFIFLLTLSRLRELGWACCDLSGFGPIYKFSQSMIYCRNHIPVCSTLTWLEWIQHPFRRIIPKCFNKNIWVSKSENASAFSIAKDSILTTLKKKEKEWFHVGRGVDGLGSWLTRKYPKVAC